MNYYEHHIGDYAAATGHLSLIEDAVYTRMLRRYYLTEAHLPADVQQVMRLVGARHPEECAAVEAVLHEFFTLGDDGWHQKRADEDIERYRAKIEAARENGRRGGRPPNKPSEKGSVNSGSENKTQLKAHQAPDTSLHKEQEQKKERSPNGSRLPADWALPADWRAWAKAERPELDPDREAASFADYWRGVAGAKGRKADWPGTWRNWIRRADGPRARAGPAGQQSKTLTAIQTLQGMKHGNLDSRRDSGRPEPAALLGHGSDPGG